MDATRIWCAAMLLAGFLAACSAQAPQRVSPVATVTVTADPGATVAVTPTQTVTAVPTASSASKSTAAIPVGSSDASVCATTTPLLDDAAERVFNLVAITTDAGEIRAATRIRSEMAQMTDAAHKARSPAMQGAVSAEANDLGLILADEISQVSADSHWQLLSQQIVATPCPQQSTQLQYELEAGASEIFQ